MREGIFLTAEERKSRCSCVSALRFFGAVESVLAAEAALVLVVEMGRET